jgi:hypothetical protein
VLGTLKPTNNKKKNQFIYFFIYIMWKVYYIFGVFFFSSVFVSKSFRNLYVFAQRNIIFFLNDHSTVSNNIIKWLLLWLHIKRKTFQGLIIWANNLIRFNSVEIVKKKRMFFFHINGWILIWVQRDLLRKNFIKNRPTIIKPS